MITPSKSVPAKESGIKKSRPFLCDIEGTRVQMYLHTRGATLIATARCIAYPREVYSSHRCDSFWRVTTFLLAIVLYGNHPSSLLTSSLWQYSARRREIFFGWPLTKAFWEGRAIPNFHSVSDRCRLPHPVLYSLNTDQSVMRSCR